MCSCPLKACAIAEKNYQIITSAGVGGRRFVGNKFFYRNLTNDKVRCRVLDDGFLG